MRLFKHRSTRFFLGLVLILTVAIGSSAIAAFADSPSTQVAVNAGSFSESGPTSVSANPITLNGTDQTATYTMDIAVVDDTGSGSGWNLTVTSTTFSTGNCTSTGHNLSASASTVTGVAMAQNGAGTYTNPTNSVSYPFSVPAACTAPTAVKLFNAAANTGLGHFKLTPTVNIAIPANTYAGTYTSTVTLAIVTGP